MRNQRLRVLVVALLIPMFGCEDDGSSTSSVAFASAARTPAAKQVYLSYDFSQATSVALSIRVRSTNGIQRADLRLQYDPGVVAFLDHASGSLLEQGGGSVTYSVAEEAAGVLHVEVERPTGTVNADETDPRLVQLAFELITPGSSVVSFFTTSELKDGLDATIPGMAFFGGTVTPP